jgi:transposase
MKIAAEDSTPCPERIETEDARPSPFSQTIITLTQEEHVKLKWDASYWKCLHKQLKQKNEDLQQALESAQARIRDLEQRLYGKKSEKGASKRDKSKALAHTTPPRPRGQQKDSQGHGRTSRPDLPVIEEAHDLAPEDRLCPICTEPYRPLSQTEDSEIVELEVKGYIRRIKRKMYSQGCHCPLCQTSCRLQLNIKR